MGLTDKAREFLDKIPPGVIRTAIDYQCGGVIAILGPDFDKGLYAPVEDLKAYLAEREANEAEIERRIGEMLKRPDEIMDFEYYEAEGKKVLYLSPYGFVYRTRPTESKIPIPTARIRAALDKHRRNMICVGAPKERLPIYISTQMKPKVDPDPDDVGEGPWRAFNQRPCSRWIVGKSAHLSSMEASWWYKDGRYTELEARALAVAEARRLNAKWREERDAKAKEIDPELRRRLWNRVLGFVGIDILLPYGLTDVFIDDEGIVDLDVKTPNCTRAQAEAFLAEIKRMGEMT